MIGSYLRPSMCENVILSNSFFFEWHSKDAGKVERGGKHHFSRLLRLLIQSLITCKRALVDFHVFEDMYMELVGSRRSRRSWVGLYFLETCNHGDFSWRKEEKGESRRFAIA